MGAPTVEDKASGRAFAVLGNSRSSYGVYLNDMRKKALTSVVTLGVVIAAAVLGVFFSERLHLALLTPAELALKLPSPPDDSCFQIQRSLSDTTPPEDSKEGSGLGVDEIAIYNAVLKRWNSKSSKQLLRVSNRTTPLDQNISDCECLKGINIESVEKATRSFHLLTRDALTSKAIRLVDAEEQSQIMQANDPHNLMTKGVSVRSALEEAFANGLFTLSEIAFDKTNQRAIVSYSFVCGSLCGTGGVWSFEKVDGVWKKSDLVCSGWMS
jgi:hypothetical protein